MVPGTLAARRWRRCLDPDRRPRPAAAVFVSASTGARWLPSRWRRWPLVVGVLPVEGRAKHLIEAIRTAATCRARSTAHSSRVMVAAQGRQLPAADRGRHDGPQPAARVAVGPGFHYQRAAVLAMLLNRYGITGDRPHLLHAVKERRGEPEVEGVAIVPSCPWAASAQPPTTAPTARAMSQNVDPDLPLRDENSDPVGCLLRVRIAPWWSAAGWHSRYGTLDVLGQDFPVSDDKGRSTAQDAATLGPPEAPPRASPPTHWSR